MKTHLVTITLSNDAFKKLVPDAPASASRANKLAAKEVARLVEKYLGESKPSTKENTITTDSPEPEKKTRKKATTK